MSKHEHLSKRIVSETKKHVVRNKWLSVASTIVIALTFMIASLFIALVAISSRTISTFEKKAQIIIFFQNDTPEEEIFAIRDTLDQSPSIDSIEYISKEQALEIYKQDFQDDPTLVESVTSEALPPSLGIRATDIESVADIIRTANDLKEENENIEEIMYFKDVIDSLRSVSKVINIGGSALVVALSIVAVVLILITIGFNINAHKSEIEVMRLIGSTDSYIRIPFLLEGAMYGAIGAGVAIGLLLTLWYSGISLLSDGDMFLFVSQTFQDIDMPYLKEFDPVFVSAVSAVEIAAGAGVGFLSSLFATRKYLK
ncbi:MAG: permease-like cell division protein FtsX [Candidatus Dojkabacteria bacterium]|nr:permease-like cell division protein FtsX [Candidatus Dojkabacteria bacterium]